MSWLWTLAAVIGMLLILPQADAAPIKGGFNKQLRQMSSEVFKVEFRGGERACVLALRTSDEKSTLSLKVEDADGNLVAEGSGDLVTAAIWYPPRDGTYRITASATRPAAVYLAFK